MADDFFEWIHPDGTTITFKGKPFILRTFEGIGSNEEIQQTQSAPFQFGTNLLNLRVQPRTVALSIRIIETDTENMHELREKLSKALFISPTHHNVRLSKGELIYRRGVNNPARKLQCVPVNSPQFVQVSFVSNVMDADLEFFADYPYWFGVNGGQTGEIKQAGLEFPLEFPIEFKKRETTTITVTNNGDVSAEPEYEVLGPADTFTITNETRGEALKVNASLGTGEKIKITTEFGNKTVTKIDVNGNETNAFGLVDIENSFFPTLSPGDNTITFDVTPAEQGSLTLTFTPRFVGA